VVSGGSDFDLAAVLSRKLGAERGKWALRRVNKAADAFAREYHQDALSQLKPVMDTEAADVAEVRELYGLVLYRLGRWRAAARALEAFASLTRSCEQAPVLADCYRAMERWEKVDEVWDELRSESPSAALVVEGRIVAAGALADRGLLGEAVALLADGWRTPRNPQEFHLRRAYALADLYDRGGDLPAARRLFAWIDRHAPDFADAADRVADLAP
jgi:tetratricopeptide (TPR) repeat protein